MSQKTKLTSVEKHFVKLLEKGRKFSKCGHKFYMNDAQFVTKEFKLRMSAFDKLIEMELIRMADGGRIELVN